jgi:hypothetical protein
MYYLKLPLINQYSLLTIAFISFTAYSLQLYSLLYVIAYSFIAFIVYSLQLLIALQLLYSFL